MLKQQLSLICSAGSLQTWQNHCIIYRTDLDIQLVGGPCAHALQQTRSLRVNLETVLFQLRTPSS